MDRKAVKKSVRFATFERDDYKCRYCGKQPPAVTLVIDHIVPVSRGGTNNIDNLAVSCEDCNNGKGAVELETSCPSNTLGDAQCEREQIRDSQHLQNMVEARANARNALVSHMKEMFGKEEILRDSIAFMVSISNQYGPSVALSWLDRAASKHATDAEGADIEVECMKYVGGCARITRERGGKAKQ